MKKKSKTCLWYSFVKNLFCDLITSVQLPLLMIFQILSVEIFWYILKCYLRLRFLVSLKHSFHTVYIFKKYSCENGP